MDQVAFSILNSTFSKARISPYLEKDDSAIQVLEKYHANISLSEAMHPTLHYFEVCLRNRIDQVIKKHYGADWLINYPRQLILSEQDIKKIESIASKVRRENKKEPVHDDIVAQMTFGFWCSFFHRKYDPAIWHRKDAVKMIFPNLPRVNRKRAYIENKILTIKEIRNRIAHHEPVWNRKISIIEAHTICHELIHAMSNDAVEMLKSIDRFSSVYQKLVTKPKVSSL